MWRLSTTDPQGYWQTIGYLLAQLHGLADGYEAARDADGSLAEPDAFGMSEVRRSW